MRDHIKWLQGIDIGSEVCTCKCEHRRVTEILEECTYPKIDLSRVFHFSFLFWLEKLVPAKYEDLIPHVGIPFNAACWLSEKYQDLCDWLGWVDVVDTLVLVDNGDQYYLSPCCDDPNECRAEKRGCKESIT